MVRILEAYVPMKIQIRQEEVWASQFQRNKACIGTQRMHRLDAGHSDYKFMCKACGTGWPEAANHMQALPAEEVANKGARALTKVTWRVRVSTPARAPFRRRRRRTSAPRTPTRHGCLTTILRCRHGQMISGRLSRGAEQAPGDLWNQGRCSIWQHR